MGGGGEGCEGAKGWMRAVGSLGRRISRSKGLSGKVTYIHGGLRVEGSV